MQGTPKRCIGRRFFPRFARNKFLPLQNETQEQMTAQYIQQWWWRNGNPVVNTALFYVALME